MATNPESEPGEKQIPRTMPLDSLYFIYESDTNLLTPDRLTAMKTMEDAGQVT